MFSKQTINDYTAMMKIALTDIRAMTDIQRKIESYNLSSEN